MSRQLLRRNAMKIGQRVIQSYVKILLVQYRYSIGRIAIQQIQLGY